VPRTVPFLLLALAAPLLAGCGDDGESTTTTTAPAPTTTAAPPSTTEPPGEPIDPAVLAVGDCFEERVISGQGQTEVDEEQMVTVDCAGPHLNEVYLIADMPEEDGVPFPGAEVVDAFAVDTCLTAFEPFVGADYVTSRFDIGYTLPTEETWVLPDRRVTCFVFDRSGEKTTGSAAGSGE
jgi:hypothetical protein